MSVSDAGVSTMNFRSAATRLRTCCRVEAHWLQTAFLVLIAAGVGPTTLSLALWLETSHKSLIVAEIGRNDISRAVV